MNLTLFVLAACLLAGSAYAQVDQGPGLKDLGINSCLNSTELPRADLSLETLIDTADDGATVDVPLATYALSQTICVSKNITLVGSPFACIDGQDATQILKIDNPKANVSVENILFTHGNGSDGGAITSQAKSLIIKNCSFYDNMANNGSGVYQKDGNLKVVNSTFKDNKAIYWGTAVYDEGGDVHLENSTFDHNFGLGVIYIRGCHPDHANVLIKGCNVSSNGRWIDCYGYSDTSVSLFCFNTNALIDHCVFNNNSLAEDDLKVCGFNTVLLLGYSKTILNDTRIERNDGILTSAVWIYGSSSSIVEMNRCNITGNHALRFNFSEGYIGEPYNIFACIDIDHESNVSMNDVHVEGNIADGGECCIIKNEGNLTLNKGTVITKNRARQYSALLNTKTGIVNISKEVVIIDNHDELQPSQPVHSEGVLNLDS